MRIALTCLALILALGLAGCCCERWQPDCCNNWDWYVPCHLDCDGCGPAMQKARRHRDRGCDQPARLVERPQPWPTVVEAAAP